ncbi:MAG: hypothetical protein Q8P68_03565 [Candidatus Peregrinibacteria bacterium]|nr:hypothetical protein [Candidatus Peregrinibacteria bacterium]MDZ4245321.1 hypothetical protein [Candidatus Gracilibacteria bacterium]
MSEGDKQFKTGMELASELEGQNNSDNSVDMTIDPIMELEAFRNDLHLNEDRLALLTDQVPNITIDTTRITDANTIQIALFLNSATPENIMAVIQKLRRLDINGAIDPKINLNNPMDALSISLEAFMHWWNGLFPKSDTLDVQIRNVDEARTVVNLLDGFYPGDVLKKEDPKKEDPKKGKKKEKPKPPADEDRDGDKGRG